MRMATASFTASGAATCLSDQSTALKPKPVTMLIFPISFSSTLNTQLRRKSSQALSKKIMRRFNICMTTTDRKTKNEIEPDHKNEIIGVAEDIAAASRVENKLARKKSERNAYLAAAIMSTFGISFMAVMGVYYRFSWQQMESGELPLLEMLLTFVLSIGAAVGMEFWARWAHRALWHAALWNMHESHHRPRDDPFELNDVFAIINAVPAVALLSFGFFNRGLVPGLCFGAGLGITVFGMAYMFVHDGLVHRRFPVGPIAQVPYLRRVAAAHHLHHKDTFNGVPYGLFLGPKEVARVGGLEELDKEIKKRMKQN